MYTDDQNLLKLSDASQSSRLNPACNLLQGVQGLASPERDQDEGSFHGIVAGTNEIRRFFVGRELIGA